MQSGEIPQKTRGAVGRRDDALHRAALLELVL